MKKVWFLLNNLNDLNFNKYLKQYLNDVKVTISEELPTNPKDYDLIVLWSYKNIIKGVEQMKNVILFHSSDLPEGKGWAPIYNTILKDLEYYTITGILANNRVDAGDIIVKAKFKMQNNHTAEFLREWDNEISIMLVSEILERFDGLIVGKTQESNGSFYEKRTPDDNEISVDKTFSEIANDLRACENQHPAFFYYKNEKYFVSIVPENKPEFPKDLEVKFYDSP